LDGVDTIVHALSTTVPSTAELDPLQQVEDSVVRMVDLLDVMVERGVSRLVFISSGGAMFSTSGLHDESSIPTPLGLYGIGKRQAEEYIQYYGRRHGIKWSILRPSNVYGPRPLMRPFHDVVTHLFRAAATGVPFQLWGEGRGRKDYLFVEDMARALLTTIFDEVDGLYHVASGERASVLELVRLIEAVTGRKICIEKTSAATFDIPEVTLDGTAFRALTGWRPKVGLSEGLARLWPPQYA